MELKNNNQPIEKIVKKGIKPLEEKRQIRLAGYLEKESTAKSFKTLLQVKKMIAQNLPKDQTFISEDIIYIFKSLQEDYKRFAYKREEDVIIELENWKGKDTIEIYKGFTNDFILTEHRKNKETLEVDTSKHEVSNVDVNRILFWIKKWEIGESHKCYDFAEIIGVKDWETIWKKRTDIYFKKYYFPLKCLEYIGIIKYGGHGLITRIK